MAASDQDDLDALIAIAQGGDREAFGRVVEAVQGDLRFFLAARAPDLDAAEEALQAGLVAAWTCLRDYRPGGTFRSWVFGICLNRLREEVRRRRRRPHTGLESAWLAACETAASETLEGDERLDRLRLCLSGLGEHALRLIDQRYGQGLSLREMASGMGRPEGTLAVTLHRLRASLLACMTKRR